MTAKSSSILIVAGEASGDMHATDLMRALSAHARAANLPEPRFHGMGGPGMREAGATPLVPMERVSVIGLFEVLRHLPRILTTFRALVKTLDRDRPELAVLVDFPDFNLRLAKHIKRRGIPVVWYISPQLWAWREHRVHEIKRLVDRMIVLFPFEVDFYRKYGMEVAFVGHPLVDRVAPSRSREDIRRDLGLPGGARVVALLPGSRRSELKTYLEPMLRAAELLHRRDPTLRFVLPLARSLDPTLIEPALADSSAPVTWRHGTMHDLLCVADAAAVASGTATLETALVGTPMVIVGRVSKLTAMWVRRVADLKFVGLVNYVLGEPKVTELLQEAMTPEAIAAEVGRLLDDPAERARLAECYADIRRRLGDGGAADRAGRAVLDLLVNGGAPGTPVGE